MRKIALHTQKASTNAFSLVELSIVLVVLGLLVGGILAGKSLIRAAELRSVTTERETYFIAVKNFRDKYFALPGDMNNATQFWGAEALPSNDGTCQTAPFSPSPSTKTCDGNGDGRIEAGVVYEPFRLWQHLANSGLIEPFRYSGHADDIFCYYISGSSSRICPMGKLRGGWSIGADIAAPNTSGYFYATTAWDYYGNAIFMTRVTTPSAVSVLRAPEVYNIDTKIDDGKPARGKVVVLSNASLTACTNTSVQTNLDAEYLIDESNSITSRKLCTLAFRQQF